MGVGGWVDGSVCAHVSLCVSVSVCQFVCARTCTC